MLLTKDNLLFFYKWKGCFEIAPRIVTVLKENVSAHRGVRSKANESGSQTLMLKQCMISERARIGGSDRLI